MARFQKEVEDHPEECLNTEILLEFYSSEMAKQILRIWSNLQADSKVQLGLGYIQHTTDVLNLLKEALPKENKNIDALIEKLKKEIPANKQDEMLWKKYELNRARWNAQMGEATREELIFLAKKGYFYHSTPKEYRRKPTKKSNYVR